MSGAPVCYSKYSDTRGAVRLCGPSSTYPFVNVNNGLLIGRSCDDDEERDDDDDEAVLLLCAR